MKESELNIFSFVRSKYLPERIHRKTISDSYNILVCCDFDEAVESIFCKTTSLSYFPILVTYMRGQNVTK